MYIPVAAASLAPAAAGVHVGTSGWAYPTWRPGFYPANVPPRAFLHYYGARLGSVEVNYTFTKSCTHDQLAEWIAATPPGFVFSFKAPQRITHFRRLLDVEALLEEFIASLAPMRREKKLGALLFQFPPNFKLDLDRLAAFLALPALRDRKLRLAFEFRNDAWFCEPVYALLRKHNIAFCLVDNGAGIAVAPQTARTHNYYRLRREGGYTPARLRAFAQRLTDESVARQTFVYLRHEALPTGARNAVSLQSALARLTAATPAGDV